MPPPTSSAGIQRPPRFSEETSTLGRERRGDRQRQRGDGSRPDAGAMTDTRAGPTEHRDHAIERSTRRGSREIVVLGRRGPRQGGVHQTEIREMGEGGGRRDRDRPEHGDDRQARLTRVRRGRQDETRVNVGEAEGEFSARNPEGKDHADRDALPRSTVEIKSSARSIGP